MLDDSIRTETGLSAREYRARQAEWWTREADACLKLDLYDLAATCRETAAGWRYGGAAVDWEGAA